MRLWSIHPKYLDAKGLVALWREGLLARKVLEGKTKGYKNHPQLLRFKQAAEPLDAIDVYLYEVVKEADVRGYAFDRLKINTQAVSATITVTDGQVEHEFQHLVTKLKVRDPKRLENEMYEKDQNSKKIKLHPLFSLIKGEIEEWERVTDALESK